MRFKKLILLFLALLFPVCIFLFLRIFGKNEFAVPPLYSDKYPEGMTDCGVTVVLPYHIPDSIQASLSLSNQDLTLVQFEPLREETKKQLEKAMVAQPNEIAIVTLRNSDTIARIRECVFFLKEPYDLVLVDDEGTIKGQYASGDRDEIDRLKMELSILLKKY